MIFRNLLMVGAWFLAVAVIYAAFKGVPREVSLPLWQLHALAAVICGIGAAVRVAWKRPFLYGLFVVTALLIPIFGPIFVLLMGFLARNEEPCPAVPVEDPFVCGVPLRESCRDGGEVSDLPFISRFRSLDAQRLESELCNLVKLEDAPLASLNRKFREHPDTKVRLLGQACLADRLNLLEGHIRQLQARLERNSEDVDALFGLCEMHLSILEQRLVAVHERESRGRVGLGWARRLSLIGERTQIAAAFFEARFALHTGECDLAAGAWARLIDVIEQRGVANPGDRFRLLGAEIGLARGDLGAVREYVAKLEPDSAPKFWLQEFWLEPAPPKAS